MVFLIVIWSNWKSLTVPFELTTIASKRVANAVSNGVDEAFGTGRGNSAPALHLPLEVGVGKFEHVLISTNLPGGDFLIPAWFLFGADGPGTLVSAPAEVFGDG